MWPYWLVFLIPAVLAVQESSRVTTGPVHSKAPPITPGQIFFGLLLTLFIGLRIEVGGDWESYQAHFARVQGHSLGVILWQGDPGFQLLNWLSDQLGWGVVGVNVFSALIFAAGLILFARDLPRPWLAIASAVPYLITVVAMGYTRQAIAISLVLLALRALGTQSLVRFIVWVLLAAAFHKSAVLMLALGVVSITRYRLLIGIFISCIAVIAYFVFLEKYVAYFYEGYIRQEYQSSGAWIRIGMNAVAAGVFLSIRSRFQLTPVHRLMWTWMALGSLALLLLLLLSPATTALDRLALYLIPLQLFVISALPDALGITSQVKAQWLGGGLVFYGLVHFIWLQFAAHAFAWLPYKNALISWFFI